ncbi:MAG: PP2C family serine/threonine-protein phosphatase [Pirellulaceae bacterium]
MNQIADASLTEYDAHMEAVRTLPFVGGEVAIFSRRSPDKTTSNEDALAVLTTNQTMGVLAVADGCGGESNGLEAAQRAISALAQSVSAANSPDSLRAAILDGFELAGRRVAELGGRAATTLIAVEFGNHLIRTYHVGDSQALLVGGRGKVKLQTRAHSPVGYAMEAGMLTEDAALEHEDRHIVSNVIGSPESHIDMGLPRPLSKRDTLIIGSDGLYDNLTQAEIVDLIRKGSLGAAAEATRQKVAERMRGDDATAPCKPDDFTMLIFRPCSSTDPV